MYGTEYFLDFGSPRRGDPWLGLELANQLVNSLGDNKRGLGMG